MLKKISKRNVRKVFNRLRYYNSIKELSIKNSGLTFDGVPYVKLEDGLIFYGYRSTTLEDFLYIIFINKTIKNKLIKECIHVAYDIVFRYQEIPNREYYTDHKKGDVVLEVGAFIGYYAMRAAKLVGESGHVIAIEAIDENFSILEKNIKDNKFRNVSVVNKASWNSKGSLEFSRHHRQRASAKDDVVKTNYKVNVNCDKVDNILNELGINHVDFIRIQVNGAELETLEGLENTLKKLPKLSVATMYDDQKGDVILFLRNLGYEIQDRGGSVFAH